MKKKISLLIFAFLTIPIYAQRDPDDIYSEVCYDTVKQERTDFKGKIRSVKTFFYDEVTDRKTQNKILSPKRHFGHVVNFDPKGNPISFCNFDKFDSENIKDDFFSTISYHANGKIKTITMPGKIVGTQRFNEKGHIIESIWTDSLDYEQRMIYKYIYDDDGHVLEEREEGTCKIKKDTFPDYRHRVNTLDKKGNITQSEYEFFICDHISRKVTNYYSYDGNNNCIVATENLSYSIIKTKYDSNNKPYYIEITNPYGNIIITLQNNKITNKEYKVTDNYTKSYHYSYTYDKLGNWIELRINIAVTGPVNYKVVKVIKRKVEYY